MARLGDNPIGLYTNKTSIFPFLFHPPIPKSVNLIKLDQGRDVGKQNQNILARNRSQFSWETLICLPKHQCLLTRLAN